MTSRLPPLNALRAFEAVARFGSIRAASRELRTSASTISTHIRNLEYFLGHALIERNANSIALTSAGARYAEEVKESFGHLLHATEELFSSASAGSVKLTCVPSLATTWMPDIFREFKAANPTVDIEFDFSPLPRKLYEEGFDLAVRYGQGKYKDDHSEFLLTDRVAPVCSPETQQWMCSTDTPTKVERIECAEGLGTDRTQWQHWRALVPNNDGMASLESQPVTFVNSVAFAIETLLSSRAVAILDHNSVKAELTEGKLVCPFGSWVDAQNSYFVVFPKRKPLARHAKQLKAMLKSYAEINAAPPL